LSPIDFHGQVEPGVRDLFCEYCREGEERAVLEDDDRGEDSLLHQEQRKCAPSRKNQRQLLDQMHFGLSKEGHRRVGKGKFWPLKRIPWTHFQAFFRYGSLVARRPLWAIVLSVILCLLLGSGIGKYEEEDDGLKLWLPKGTKFRDDSMYLNDEFDGDGTRTQSVQVSFTHRNNSCQSDLTS